MKWISLGLTFFLLPQLPPASACPFCLAPLQTWSEIVSEADAVCQARLVSSHAGDDDRQPWAVLEFTSVHKGERFKAGEQIRLEQYVYGKPGDLFLMTGRLQVPSDQKLVETFATDADGKPVAPGKGAVQQVSATTDAGGDNRANPADNRTTDAAATRVMQWDYVEAMSEQTCRYILEAPALDAANRLTYFLRFLEHTESGIASDAWGEFANADYTTICKVRSEFDAAALREWIVRKDTSPERLGLYGMMLGLCGDAADAAFLRQQILGGSTDELRFGVEGLMGGLLLIAPEEGLAFLEEQLILRADLGGAESLAVVQALQFVWTYEPDLISKDRLRAALHPMLDKASVREIVIRNMSRWNDWSAVSQLAELYDDAADNDPGTVRAIVGFLLTCRKAATADEASRQQAERLLKTIEAAQPRIVRMMKMQIR